MVLCLKMIRSFLILFLVISFIISQSIEAQNKQDKKPEVRVSPKATIMQTIGFTDISISYSRPGVKGRKIWGGLVPYDKVWRAGANEATKFTFRTDVMIAGKKLAKGSYSFFAIPGKKEWTLIFNKVADQWGAFTYNEGQDALRFKVKPVQSKYTEWLKYDFTGMDVQKAGMNNSAVINLNWEKLRVPFKIEVETKD